MVPAVARRRKKEAVRDTSKGSALETISSVLQATVMFPGFAVLMHGGRSCGDVL